MTLRQDLTGDERSANDQLAASCPLLKAAGSRERWCCDGRCSQGRNCPVKEIRGVPGGGIVRAAIVVILVAACAVIAFRWLP